MREKPSEDKKKKPLSDAEEAVSPNGSYPDVEYVEIEEEYISPGEEIEIDDDEEVEIIDNSRPPMPNFPPPPFGFPPPPPPPSPRIELVSDDEDDEIEIEDNVMVFEIDEDSAEDSSVERPADEKEGESAEDENAEDGEEEEKEIIPVSINVMKTAQADVIKELGKLQSEKIKSGEFVSSMGKFLKYFFNFLLFSLLGLGCYMIVEYYRGQMGGNMASNGDSQKNSATVQGWRLPDSKANIVVRRFYEATGGLSQFSEYSDMLVKGNLDLNGESESFYCIKRSNGRSYIRIGTENKPRAYFVGLPAEEVVRLVELRTAGRKAPLPEKESLVLRGIVGFDEVLFKRAFGEIEQSRNIGEFIYEGFQPIDGKDMEAVSVNDEKISLKYFFDNSTRELKMLSMSDGTNVVMVKYYDYQQTDNGVKYPNRKDIFLNGKLVAKVNTMLILTNKGFLFP